MRLLLSVRCPLFVGLVLLSQVSIGDAFNNLSGTYAFGGSATLNDPGKLFDGRPSCGGANNVAGSLNNFFQTLVSDIRAGKCGGGSARPMKSMKLRPGDHIHFTGAISADGFGHFTVGRMLANSSNLASEVPNFGNTGASAVLCGGAEDGECSSLFTVASPGCDTRGGDIAGTGTIYAYPVAGSLCGGRSTFAFAECCNDPTLVVVSHQSVTLSNVNTVRQATNVRSILIDQGLAGSAPMPTCSSQGRGARETNLAATTGRCAGIPNPPAGMNADSDPSRPDASRRRPVASARHVKGCARKRRPAAFARGGGGADADSCRTTST